MKKAKLILMVIAAVSVSSCSKKILETTHIDGNYTGVFEIANADSAATAKPLSGHLNLNLTGMDYTCSANSNYSYASGGGKFFLRKDVINFTDIMMHPARFDWNMVLNGSYAYKFDGKQITLVKKSGNKTYTYHLKKQ